eukprot:CAMPEP_0119269750 /NCGR_PEP_ID=MMETSP1329-20130426/7027_1 /TAXON_ID=114041 /ORGANISM="Genus nov. species nov., Strain RCC1024" /LENGTH=173 /DNA_ID=CAMNT_0007269751 /DNA_START=203 /DNA_END=721 /DNA_ORIENTATION=+
MEATYDPSGTRELETILKNLNLERFVPLFVREEIDDSCLEWLADKDLRDVGLPLGPRLKVSRALEVWRRVFGVPAAADATAVSVDGSAPSSPSGALRVPMVSQDEALCPVCLDAPTTVAVDCAGGHEFCAPCVEAWQGQTVLKAGRTTCPNCREDITHVVDIATGRPVEVERP